MQTNAKPRSEQEIEEDALGRREISRGEFTRTVPLSAARQQDRLITVAVHARLA